MELIASELLTARTTLQCAMCYTLTALVAFSFDTHATVAAAGLVPQLVALCRPSCRLRTKVREEGRIPQCRDCSKYYVCMSAAGARPATILTLWAPTSSKFC